MRDCLLKLIMARVQTVALATIAACIAGGGDALFAAQPNLVRNPGFEEAMEPAWHKRTPEDAKRRLVRVSPGRTGDHCLLLENVEDAYTRMRQGADRAITIVPGSLVKLSVWVKSELPEGGRAIVQLYSIGEEGKITGQPTAKPISAPCDWTYVELLAQIPERTRYCMPYLQIKDGVGKVFFDDVVLRVVREPRARTPQVKVAVFSDLSEEDPCLTNLKSLFGDGFVPATPELSSVDYADCVGALFAFASADLPPWAEKALEGLQAAQKPVFMDIRVFSAWAGLTTIPVAAASADNVAYWIHEGADMDVDLTVTYADEFDGAGKMRLLHNGNLLKTWVLDTTPADASDVAKTISVPAVKLLRGDRLAFELLPDRGEMCRLDRIDVRPHGGNPFTVQAEDMVLGKNVKVESPALMFAKGIRASSLPKAHDRMQFGLRVVAESPVTRGFLPGQTIPWCGTGGSFLALNEVPASAGIETLAETATGQAALVRKGLVVAVDVLSLGESFYANVPAFYKYLPVVNTLTNGVCFGEYYLKRYRYAEFAELVEETAARSDTVRLAKEGEACDGQPMLSLNLGTAGKPMYFLYGACHGSEWEPAYGLLTFARQVAAGKLDDVIDLRAVSIKILPILNPSGYDRFRRKNANGVDLNRQGDHAWDSYSAAPRTEGGEYGEDNARWKGKGPFTEPEAIVYRRICEAPNLHCVLDFHGNPTATANKVGVLACTARPDNQVRGCDLQHIVNERLRGRYILQQNREESCSPYLIDRVSVSSNSPYLMNTSARDRYGILVELTAAYRSSYGTVLQTDVTSEVCRALFLAYPVPE